MSETLGKQLASARANKGVSIEEIARLTKINAKFIRMLEEDRYDLLPGMVFIKGLLRTYAGVLGLSADEMVTKFEELGVEIQDRSPKLISMPLNPKTGIGKKIAAGVAGAALITGLLYYYLEPVDSRPPQTIEQRIKDREIKTPDVTVATPTAKTGETITPGSGNASPSASQPAPAVAPSLPVAVKKESVPAPAAPAEAKPSTPAAAKVPVASAASTGAVKKEASPPAPPAPAMQVAAKPVAPAPAPAPAKPPVQAGQSGSPDHKLTITASEESWIGVAMDNGGSRHMTLQAGQSVTFLAKTRFRLTVGNVGGTKAWLDGEQIRFRDAFQNVMSDMEIPAAKRPGE